MAFLARSRDVISMCMMIATAYVILSFSTQPVNAKDLTSGNLVISQPWSRATPDGSKVAGGYLTIKNNGRSPERLTGSRTAAANRVEIHKTTLHNGIVMMRPIESGLVVAPGQTVTFAPGGDHLMFIGIKDPLRQHDSFPVTLMFESAGDVTVDFVVQPLGAKAPDEASASHVEAPHIDSITETVAAPEDDRFFQHLHGDRAMANITIDPARVGHAVVMVQLETPDERPLSAQSLSVTLTNPQGVRASVNAMVERADHDQWRVVVSIPSSGRWEIELYIQLSSSESVLIDGPVLIK